MKARVRLRRREPSPKPIILGPKTLRPTHTWLGSLGLIAPIRPVGRSYGNCTGGPHPFDNLTADEFIEYERLRSAAIVLQSIEQSDRATRRFKRDERLIDRCSKFFNCTVHGVQQRPIIDGLGLGACMLKVRRGVRHCGAPLADLRL
jgi:hypothetical protein